MNDYDKNSKRNSEYSFNEDLELFKRAICEALGAKVYELEKETENTEIPPLSKRYKK